MKILILLFLLLAFGTLDLYKLWQKKDWYEMVIFGVLLLFGITYGVFFALSLPLPDPNGLLKMVFGPIGKQLLKPLNS
jgi:hypothetical protein